MLTFSVSQKEYCFIPIILIDYMLKLFIYILTINYIKLRNCYKNKNAITTVFLHHRYAIGYDRAALTLATSVSRVNSELA